MGADGHVVLWRRDTVKKVFPDAATLFEHMPGHRCGELNGELYDFVYWDTERTMAWYDDVDDWDLRGDTTPSRERVQVFIAWLKANETDWEVWT